MSEISQAVSEAYDILVADGVAPQQAATIATLSEEQWKTGQIKRDPVAYARHFVELRKAARGE